MKISKSTISANFLLACCFALLFADAGNAQERDFRNQSWRIGLNGGANYNSASLGWQQLHQNPVTGVWEENFHSEKDNIDHSDGTGWGPYGGIFGEYLSSSWWGIQFRISYDARDALVEDNTRTPVPSFDTKMNYLSFEPLFRVDQHLIPNLNFYAGPFIAANIHGTFVYKPDITQSATEPEVKVENRNIVSWGAEGGVAYDILIANMSPTSSMYLSPFFDVSWLLNQRKSTGQPMQNSTTDIWSTMSFRFGLRLSLDFAHPREHHMSEVRREPPRVEAAPAKQYAFVTLPYNGTIVTKNVTGYYPLHPYVFFEKGKQDIPSRYILLSPAEARSFHETNLGMFTKGDYTEQETNVGQLTTVYYNVLNIYADRMRKNPSEQLILRGCDPEEREGEAYAMAVKNYLVNNFGIEPGRITIVVEPPVKPSGSSLTDPAFASLIDDENRRVVMVFRNQDMYIPLPYTIKDESTIDNDMVFTIRDGVRFSSWNLTITGDNGTATYGPFKYSKERINPVPLMSGLQKGTFNARIDLVLQNGERVTENLGFTLYRKGESKNAARYLMLFDYNKSDAIKTYEKKIRNEITPGMHVGNTVIIHGHTDIIGNEAANLTLSQERADEAKRIVDDELGKNHQTVNVQAIGTGQTTMQYTFDNTRPEGRMYNRNVFVEIIE